MSEPRAFRVLQLGRPSADETQRNELVDSLQTLVTHHPLRNRHAYMERGSILGVENPNRRTHAFLGGDFEEVIDLRVDKQRRLGSSQVLLVKDFILEDPSPSNRAHPRAVEVPAPVGGWVSRVVPSAGMVEIAERPGGDVIARVRHLSPIAVAEGEEIRYGDNLGTQGNTGLNLPAGRSIHVHLEMDTRHYLQYEAYIEDLVNGRLPVQAEHRRHVSPPQLISDGTFRLGESHPRIRDLQQVMANEGYRAAGGGPLDQDGVYRLGMQGALLDFQHDHGVTQTGDIDPATLQFAPRSRGRVPDLPDHFQPGLPMPRLREPATAPGHPDHPDHRPGLPTDPGPRINQRADPAAALPPLLLPLADALRHSDERGLSEACAQIAGSEQVSELLRDAREQVGALHTLDHDARQRDAAGLAPA